MASDATVSAVSVRKSYKHESVAHKVRIASLGKTGQYIAVVEMTTDALIAEHCKSGKGMLDDSRSYPRSTRLLLLNDWVFFPTIFVGLLIRSAGSEIGPRMMRCLSLGKTTLRISAFSVSMTL